MPSPRNSEETKKLVRDMWMKGYSALYIGNKTGRTRRSIIGIVWRLGLMRADRPANPAPHKQRRHNQFTGRQPPIPLKALLGQRRSDGEPVNVKDIPMPEPSVAARNGYRRDGKLIKLMGLRFDTCRWPVGDPQDPKFGYCGAQTQPPCVYCVIHRKVAYHSPARRV